MRTLTTFFITLLSFHAAAFAVETIPPHLGPMGGRFNRLHTMAVEKTLKKHIQKNLRDGQKDDQSEEQKTLDFLLSMSKRAVKWLDAVNAHRAPERKLDLSNPNPTGGYPITKIYKTNTAILVESYEKFLKNTSPLVTNVITSGQDFPVDPPVSDADFIIAMRTLDKVYQNTIRWSGSLEWLEYYAERAVDDIRGFYFLRATANADEQLKNFKSLTKEEQEKYSFWLLGICRNAEASKEECLSELNDSIANDKVDEFYEAYKPFGQKKYDELFSVTNPRPEMSWNQDKTQLNAPFLLPNDSAVQKWLKTNVEEEWKNTEFKLVIDYKVNTPDIPRIEFKEGVTAHVNGIGGDLITMEAEYPIESLDQRWTIRHEYGHVLGFSDCYLEFYDTNEKAMIYYETEVDNLMCSRSGHIKPTHFEQLQKSYK